MAVVFHGGNIEQRYFDLNMRDKCVKINVNGEFIYRKELKMAISQRMDLQNDDIDFIYKEDKAREWFVVFRKLKDADRLVQMHNIQLRSDTSITCERITQQKLTLKIHWLPAYVRNEFLHVFFSKYGKVTNIVDNWSLDAHTRTGMREVTLLPDQETTSSIPHMVTFEEGIKMPVTCPGRLPLCLKCNSLGHVRKDCTATFGRNNRGSNSYANTVRGDISQKEKDSNVMPEAGNPQEKTKNDPPINNEKETENVQQIIQKPAQTNEISEQEVTNVQEAEISEILTESVPVQINSDDDEQNTEHIAKRVE